jgi:hypothetical protein
MQQNGAPVTGGELGRGRQVAMMRKSAPIGAPTTGGESGPDVETCPNCDCQFVDGDSGKPGIIKAGLPVQGKRDTSTLPGNEGPDLDMLHDSDQPVPGKFGSARDGAVGTTAMAHLLGALGGH